MKRKQHTFDVVIVGAGPAGIGTGIILSEAGIKNFCIVERYEVGASFRRWPEEMRFITPSFPGNAFEMLDLNSVALQTSPGYSLKTEHPSGKAYAEYLEMISEYFELPIQTGIDVTSIRKESDYFTIQTHSKAFRSRFLIWAGGEFQYPNLKPFTGAKHCIHNSQIMSWKKLKGDDFIVIGAYESGADAAIQLSKLGKNVTVLGDTSPWRSDTSDPSITLSPFTFDRLKDEMTHGRINILDKNRVATVTKDNHGYIVTTCKGRSYSSESRPILATGFKGSLQLIDELFEKREDMQVLVNEFDESTKTEGLFIVGPSLRHDGHIFYFIYKFRQRFGVVVEEILKRLKQDIVALDVYKSRGMYLSDLSCCGEECSC